VIRQIGVHLLLLVLREHHAVVHVDQGFFQLLSVFLLLLHLGKFVDCFEALSAHIDQSFHILFAVVLESDGEIAKTVQYIGFYLSVVGAVHECD
jgi:hypothetical protein